MGLGRLSTIVNLARRVVNIPTICCLLCNALRKTVHIFKNCSIAKEICGHLLNWWKYLLVVNDSFNGLLGLNSSFTMATRPLEILEVMSRAFLWNIRTYRNDLVLKGMVERPNTLAYEVNVLAFLWIKSKAKWGRDLLSEAWANNPLYCTL